MKAGWCARRFGSTLIRCGSWGDLVFGLVHALRAETVTTASAAGCTMSV